MKTSMTSLKELLDLGRELGYEGSDLLEFTRAEQAQERENRQREREDRAREQEREERMREREIAFEREEREKDRAYQLQMAQLKVTQSDSEKEGDVSDSSVKVNPLVKVKGPSLPVFDENCDDLDAYLRRFELFANTAGWPEESWAIILSSHLKGVALEVYSRLGQGDALNYEKVKKALMIRFECTEEGFRQKFRSSKPQRGENVSQFLTRLRNCLNRWIELSNCNKTYEGVLDLFIAEQFLKVCGKQLQMYLREKMPLSLGKMIEKAEKYVTAHGGLYQNAKTSHQFTKKGQETTNDEVEPQRSEKSVSTGKEIRCFKCHKLGHKSFNCPPKSKGEGGATKKEAYTKKDVCAHAEVLACGHVVEVVSAMAALPTVRGTVCGRDVEVLRDTGCSTVVVRKSLVPHECMTGKHCLVKLIDSQVCKYPLAQITVNTPYYSGSAAAVCMDTPIYDLIIGNIAGATCLSDHGSIKQEVVNAVVTRAAGKRPPRTRQQLRSFDLTDQLSMTPADLKHSQQEDVTLKRWLEKAQDEKWLDKMRRAKVIMDNGLLYRIVQDEQRELKQLVLPTKVRSAVMKVGHECLFGGHLGATKTLGRLQQDFAWPGMIPDIRRYCQSCDICQKTTPKGKVGKVPLGEVPVIEVPFKRVAVDLVGPIEPRSEQGNRYILTLVDYATRYPEATALTGIDTEQVAEALINIFSRVGVPEELVSDRGSQFTSGMMDEVRRLLSIKHLPTTPYHAMGNGLVEKFNGTLKSMLKKMCAEQPSTWDRYLPAVLFAYREAPQVSLGFSPFELLYGRTVRGPSSILRELWDQEKVSEVNTTYQYVFELREKLEETCKLAHENLRKAQGRYKFYYDRKAKDKKFKVGDKVLLLLPTTHNKLLLQWKGPYPVVERKGQMDYIVDMNGKHKIFHANMLKRYVSRPDDTEDSATAVCSTAVVDCEEDADLSELVLLSLNRKEKWEDVNINAKLTAIQQQEVNDLLLEFDGVLSDIPGRTSVIKHQINLVQEEVVRSRPYKIPFSLRSQVNQEIEDMLKLKVIEPSNSPYVTPIVVVKKPDNSNRICLDFRRLNQITVFDSEPMTDPDQIFANIRGSKYFSKLDLSKGYWQVPLEEESKQYTAFPTDKGLFQFTVLAFGLVNAPATFNKLMRSVL